MPRGMKVTNVLRGNVIEGPPIAQEGVQGPSPGGLDNIGRGPSDQQLGCASNLEAVTSCAWVAKVLPNLIAMLEEDWFGQ